MDEEEDEILIDGLRLSGKHLGGVREKEKEKRDKGTEERKNTMRQLLKSDRGRFSLSFSQTHSSPGDRGDQEEGRRCGEKEREQHVCVCWWQRRTRSLTKFRQWTHLHKIRNNPSSDRAI